jgi:hypothetical protein
VILIGFLEQYGPVLCVVFVLAGGIGGYVRDRRRGVRSR